MPRTAFSAPSLLLGAAFLAGGCASMFGARPDGQTTRAAVPEAVPVVSRYGGRADVLGTIAAVKSAGQIQLMGSRAVRLPTLPLQSITSFVYRYPDTCGGHEFRVLETAGTQILEYAYMRQNGSMFLIRDYVAGPSPFMQPGLWSSSQVLGRGNMGPGDTSMSVNGNTPTGEYEVSQIADTSSWNQNSYGPNGALRLKPLSGNALAAEQQFGRAGLLIHGGSPGGANYWRGAGELRATHGCLRLSNRDVQRLRDLIWAEGLNEQNLVCEPVNVRVTVTDHPMSFRRP